MCGIFGAIGGPGGARGEAPLRHPDGLPRMAAALRHRGPGGECIVGHERPRIGGRRLVLARDRAGEKPLFWTEVEGELRFASEIQALLEFPDQPRRLNRKALSLYHALGYVPAPYTMFDGIHKLPPASLLIAEGERTEIRSYWSAAEAASRPSSLSLANIAELRETLLRAVKRELMSDVPLGVFTSGGLESSLLVAAAARAIPGERIHTFAVRFSEPGYDESAYAEAVRHQIASVHHVVIADDESLGRALEVVSRSLAEPLGDPAVLPTWLLAEAARENVKVILSGEGADELFGGYPTYLGHKFAATWQGLPRPLRSTARWVMNRWPSEEHTSELQSRLHLVCRLLLEKKKHRAEHCSSTLVHPRYRPVRDTSTV